MIFSVIRDGQRWPEMDETAGKKTRRAVHQQSRLTHRNQGFSVM
jgi:hypothetical protein